MVVMRGGDRVGCGLRLRVQEDHHRVVRLLEALAVEALAQPTPWEVCDEVKASIATAVRPLRWQADMAEEVEELAEAEAQWAERQAESKRELEARATERDEARARMEAQCADGFDDLSPELAATMLTELQLLSERVRDAQHACASAAREANERGDSAADEGEQSLVDILLDVIFAQQPRPRNQSGAALVILISSPSSLASPSTSPSASPLLPYTASAHMNSLRSRAARRDLAAQA